MHNLLNDKNYNKNSPLYIKKDITPSTLMGHLAITVPPSVYNHTTQKMQKYKHTH